MADFIGQLLSNVPSWLTVPALAIVIILIIIGWWLWTAFEASAYGADAWPFKARRVYLGEKKNAKK